MRLTGGKIAIDGSSIAFSGKKVSFFLSRGLGSVNIGAFEAYKKGQVMNSVLMIDETEATANAFFPQLTRPVRQVTGLLLNDFTDPGIMQGIKSDEVHVFCFESEENTLIGHVFAGTRMEILLRHHHKRGQDDLLLFTCSDFSANKPFMQKDVHYASFVDLNSLEGKEAFQQGKILLAIDEAKEASQERLCKAIGNLKAIYGGGKNFSYHSEGITKATITPLTHYFSS